MPRPLAGCIETLKRFNEALHRFRIYALSYEALLRFIEALSNLTRPRLRNNTISSELYLAPAPITSANEVMYFPLCVSVNRITQELSTMNSDEICMCDYSNS